MNKGTKKDGSGQQLKMVYSSDESTSMILGLLKKILFFLSQILVNISFIKRFCTDSHNRRARQEEDDEEAAPEEEAQGGPAEDRGRANTEPHPSTSSRSVCASS